MNVYIGVSYEYTYRVYVHSRAHITRARTDARTLQTQICTHAHTHAFMYMNARSHRFWILVA